MDDAATLDDVREAVDDARGCTIGGAARVLAPRTQLQRKRSTCCVRASGAQRPRGTVRCTLFPPRHRRCHRLRRPCAPMRPPALRPWKKRRVLLVRSSAFQREAQPRGLARWCAHILGHGLITCWRARDIRIRMPRQQTRVGVGEDPSNRGAARPVI